MTVWQIVAVVVLAIVLSQVHRAYGALRHVLGGGHAFDALLTRRFIRGLCQKRVAFHLTVRQVGPERVYTASFAMGRNGALGSECRVKVSRGGAMLSRAKHQAYLREIEGTTAKVEVQRGDGVFDVREVLLPRIGGRAAVFLIMGPGGGGTLIVFTTSDERFDVKLSVSNRLTDGKDDPGLQPETMARALSDLYDRRVLGKL